MDYEKHGESKIKWSGCDWHTHERWGQVHPDKSWNWYDPDCVVRDGHNLLLNVKYHPKTFTFENGKMLFSPNGTGLISSVNNFGFGTFEIMAKLPRGRGLWPAFWLYASDAWPPEIDIFEGYSGKRNYRKCLLKPYRIESCLHIRDEWKINKVPVKTFWVWQFNRNPSETFNIYSLKWTPDKIEWFINGKSIRKITDVVLLDYLSDYKMRVIINNHIDERYKDDWTCESPFEIEYFRYEQF